jgi:hypothetical protein
LTREHDVVADSDELPKRRVVNQLNVGHQGEEIVNEHNFTKHLLNSGLTSDVLLQKLKKDISFAQRRGTIAQVATQALDGYASPGFVEDELALINKRRVGLTTLSPPTTAMRFITAAALPRARTDLRCMLDATTT